MLTHRLVWLLTLLSLLLALQDTLGDVWEYFDDQGLTSVPDDIDPGVDVLYCEENNISSILRSDFNDKYPDLYYLSLSKNVITSIESGCFRGTVLKNIILSVNQLTAFPDFREVKDIIRNIYIKYNLITSISKEQVSYLTNLGRLSLNGNPLVQFPDFIKLFPLLKLLHMSSIEMECCSCVVWLKRLPDTFDLDMDTKPCRTPSKWTETPWDDMSEEMLLRQRCGESSLVLIRYNTHIFKNTRTVNTIIAYLVTGYRRLYGACS